MMDPATPTFFAKMHLESPDYGPLDQVLEHPNLVILEFNGYAGAEAGAPIALIVERHIIGQDPSAPVVSLTIPELYELQDNINAAIVFAESLA